MNADQWVLLVVGLLGGGGIATVVVKVLSRNVDNATADASRSAAKKDDLDVLRGVIAELREDKREAGVRIENLEQRMAKIEERERHMLTRAAAHEAWDQLTYHLILPAYPNHSPPPPLRDSHALPPGDDGHPG